MPIRPENKHRYPRDWKQIRAAILDRAGGVLNDELPEMIGANRLDAGGGDLREFAQVVFLAGQRMN